MGTQGTRARSTAHGKRNGRITVHILIVMLAVLAVAFAARFPDSSNASSSLVVPNFSFSGLAGNTQTNSVALFRPPSTNQTNESSALLATRADASSVRAAGGVSPTSSFSSGVAAAAANSGEQGAGVKPLAEIVDPHQPFILYTAEPGDSAGLIAQKFGIALSTLLMNNPEVPASAVIQNGQQLIVPRKDGILYKVKAADTVATIVSQYDNITADAVTGYRPNAIADPNALKQGDFLLLIGATIKPPPPPPPPPPPRTPPSSGSGGSGGAPAAGSNGIFHYPLATWHGVSDPFGVDVELNRWHTGIDLDLWGLHHSSIFSACDGTVTTVEYLTYSYGYHVIVDCGGGYSTLYAHMSEIDVSVGQRVSAGTQVGVSGLTGYTTGEHLHFEIRVNGSPVNPQNYLDFGYVE
jgi:murein DD-endopeptidase MepM/ murein hydrolase activator NlpD